MLVSCSGDPTLLLDGRGGDPRREQSATLPDPAGAQPAGGTAKEGGAGDHGGSPVDAGADAHADAHIDAAGADAAPPVHAFTGAGAFVATTGPSARKAAHNFAGNTPPTSPSKQACLGCHTAGGAATPFAFGGTAFKDVGGTIPAVGVEIRARAPDGGAVSAYTDADGNFYQLAAVAFPANVGARDAAGMRLMLGAPPDGNCNAPQCHGSAHPWVNLP
jgi:hypothetical protein